MPTEVPAPSFDGSESVSIQQTSIEEASETNPSAGLGIPTHIDDNERILRILYYPVHFKIVKAKDSSEVEKRILKHKAFEPPHGLDEISVTRLEFSSADFCKEFGKKKENPAKRRTYYGLGILLASEIRAIGANIRYSPDYTPENYNPAHSDIYFGFVLQKEIPITGEQQLLMDSLASKARVYQDMDVSATVWNSGDLV